jgi:hypothetical protein
MDVIPKGLKMENVMTWSGMEITFPKRTILASVLAVVMAFTACTASWVNVALADMPVILQIALSIAQLVGAVGGTASPAELAAITAISNEGSKDLTLLQTLYNEYKANPNATTLASIQSTIATIQKNLPALLAAAHIKDTDLLARVTAAVNLIIVTVNSFAALLPVSSSSMKASRRAAKATEVPTPASLKANWRDVVCQGNAACAALVK